MLYSQEPGGKDSCSRRAWRQGTWLNWEPSDALMLCSQEPGGKDPRSRRARTQRTWLNWEPRKPIVLLPRTWRQRSLLTKSMDTEDLAQLGT